MHLKLRYFKFRPREYKWTVISFSTRIFTKTKCQVSLVVKYTILKVLKFSVSKEYILNQISHFLSVFNLPSVNVGEN